MRGFSRYLRALGCTGALLAGVLAGPIPAVAQSSATTPATRPSLKAFQNAYATSFYGFDACGDQLAGRMFRDALNAKLARCPFPAEARAQFRRWSAAQRARSADARDKLIEEHGGLPVQLEGMTNTCHEQRSSPAYVALRDKLERYRQGEIGIDAVIPEPCDADTIAP